MEREVDRYKDILQNLNKRIATTVSAGQPQDAPAKEKRIRKVPEFVLGQLMEDSVKDLPPGLLRDVLDKCGKEFNDLNQKKVILTSDTPSFSSPGKDSRVGDHHERAERGELGEQKSERHHRAAPGHHPEAEANRRQVRPGVRGDPAKI